MWQIKIAYYDPSALKSEATDEHALIKNIFQPQTIHHIQYTRPMYFIYFSTNDTTYIHNAEKI